MRRTRVARRSAPSKIGRPAGPRPSRAPHVDSAARTRGACAAARRVRGRGTRATSPTCRRCAPARALPPRSRGPPGRARPLRTCAPDRSRTAVMHTQCRYAAVTKVSSPGAGDRRKGPCGLPVLAARTARPTSRLCSGTSCRWVRRCACTVMTSKRCRTASASTAKRAAPRTIEAGATRCGSRTRTCPRSSSSTRARRAMPSHRSGSTYDPAYRFVVPLLPDEASIEIGSTRERERSATRAGWLEFAVDGVACARDGAAPQRAGRDPGSLDVYFTDATSGRESYRMRYRRGGGRRGRSHRPGFQPRLQPGVRVLAALQLPDPATREPSHGRHTRRRAAPRRTAPIASAPRAS